ncbi:hypothetical protein [Streptomyces massasporeus]|uniref:hypothetical protein n=1 Tax=Streptomyces massasporeus TaxID=67324 RepID=UPI00331744C6
MFFPSGRLNPSGRVSGTGECTYSKERTASGHGDTVILQIWRCPDGHDYAKGLTGLEPDPAGRPT